MIYMRNITITTAKSATYLENVGIDDLSILDFLSMIAARHSGNYNGKFNS